VIAIKTEHVYCCGRFACIAIKTEEEKA